MPSFGTRKAAAPSPEPTPLPAEQSVQEKLAALLAEQSEINATLVQHREQRAELLREDGSLGAIRALATEDDGLNLRLEQLALRFADVEREFEQERREQWEAAWQTHRPALASAEAELAEAIRTFHAALEHAHAMHVKARAFSDKLREFVPPPPLAPLYNDWSLRQFVGAVEQRRQQADAQPVKAVDIFIDDVPLAERFVPRKVPIGEIERISATAPPRRVHVLHGPVRVSHLATGFARFFPGETHTVPARAAHALVASGCAEYADETATAEA